MSKAAPDRWILRPLGELFRIGHETCDPALKPGGVFTHYSLPAFDETGGPALQYGREIESLKFTVERPCILVSKLNPRIPRVVVVPEVGSLPSPVASTEFIQYIARDAKSVDIDFYGYLFLHTNFMKRMQAVATGTTGSHTRAAPKETLSWWLLQPPIEEQRRIAEILDEVESEIVALRRLLSKAEHQRAGAVQLLLAEDASTAVTISLGAVLNRIDAGWSPLCAEHPPPAAEWGVLKVSAVTSGRYRHREAKALLPGFRPRAGLEVGVGDLLMCRANGVAGLVGKVALVTKTPERLMLSDKILRLVPDEAKVRADYLALFLASSAARKQIAALLSGSSGQNNISQRFVQSMAICLPSLGRQTKAASVVSAMDFRLDTYQARLSKLVAVKRGLMEDLLTGRVRVAG